MAIPWCMARMANRRNRHGGPFKSRSSDPKRNAILFHQSQKDKVMFQGEDKREFWVRAEQRNQKTAALYNQLGLAEYKAIEAFKRHLI